VATAPLRSRRSKVKLFSAVFNSRSRLPSVGNESFFFVRHYSLAIFYEVIKILSIF
jgi:hypothetical protein